MALRAEFRYEIRRKRRRAMIRDFTASTLATLLVTLDPPGLAPIFVWR